MQEADGPNAAGRDDTDETTAGSDRAGGRNETSLETRVAEIEALEELMEEPPAGELGVISDEDVPGEPG